MKKDDRNTIIIAIAILILLWLLGCFQPLAQNIAGASGSGYQCTPGIDCCPCEHSTPTPTPYPTITPDPIYPTPTPQTWGNITAYR